MFKHIPANWTPLILSKPLIHTLHMKEMETGQPPDIFLNLKLRETDCAFVSLLLLLLFFLPFLFLSVGWSPLGEFMGKSIPLNAGSACSPIHAAASSSGLQQPHILLGKNINLKKADLMSNLPQALPSCGVGREC